jgi:hypothetical protein
LALKVRSFSNGTDIIKNATEELKKLSRNDSQKYFQTPLQWLAEVNSSKMEIF